jgi:MoaA/NifB/PqqE/SkfB family radical SAM enzyme
MMQEAAIGAICKAPTSEMKELNSLFIELTAKNCNMRCKQCYIDFPYAKNVKDFISIDLIKQTLTDTKNQNLKCIYLTGAEPMTHPDFNSILRLCLKRTNVCIMTNGSFINEKKAQFLKRVKEESKFSIIFKFSINHWDEVKNDMVRARGSYRSTISALKSVVKQGFEPILCITNSYNEDKKELIEKFTQICAKVGFKAQSRNFMINEYFDPKNPLEMNDQWISLDCETGRTLTTKGIYACPLLANDHRGRSGADLKDFSKKCMLETDACANCIKNQTAMFGLDYKHFML